MTIVEQEIAPDVLTERERRARVLEAAALEIEVHGWVQGRSYDDEGRMCLMGAIGEALIPHAPHSSVMEAWDENWKVSLPHHEDESSSSPRLAAWNDEPHRTASDVTFVLRWRAQEIRDGR